MNTQVNITKNGTTTLATAGKYCDRNVDVNVNVPLLMEVHRITIAEDLTSGSHIILTNSDFVKEHGNKDGFVISLTALTPAVTGSTAIGFAYACNRVLVQQDTALFSALSFYSTGSGRNVKTQNTKANKWIYELNIPCVPNAGTNGNVEVSSSSPYSLLAGDYLLMMAVVEG